MREKAGIWMSGKVRRIWGGAGRGVTITIHSIFKNLFSVKNKKKITFPYKIGGNVF